MAKPFIVFTLRRTGGTSLMGFMKRISPYHSLEDEPFNKNRSLGYIANLFSQDPPYEDGPDPNLRKGKAEVRRLLKSKVNFKHCIDVVPFGLTKYIASQAIRNDYRIFVLTRDHHENRLRSLVVALHFNIWGPDQSKTRTADIVDQKGAIAPVSIEELERQIKSDFSRFGLFLMHLNQMDIEYTWLSFEKLYKNRDELREHSKIIANHLEIPLTKDEAFSEFFSNRRQNTSHLLDLIPNKNEVIKTIRKSVT